MRLVSWIGSADFNAWKNSRGTGDGPLLAVALHVKPARIDILWDDGSKKVPLDEAKQYTGWLEQQLAEARIRAEVLVHPCADAQVVDFGWVYSQVERLSEQIDLHQGEVNVNASSGTWVMSACWIVFKKATGLKLQLFRSSPEKGVEPIQLPPNLAIDMTEVLQGRRSPLFDRYVRGELTINVPDMVVESERLKEIYLQAQVVARFTDVAVLLLGPPGSGKSRLAKKIHDWSQLPSAAYLPVDCGSLISERSLGELWGWEKGAFTGADQPHKGLIAEADKGTAFFDEVGNASDLTQQNLLRLLQERKYRPLGSLAERSIEVRVIAATNSDLREEIRAGRFRQDLYDRLSVYVLELPPLRECREDIVPMARRRLKRFNDDWRQEIERAGRLKTFATDAERELKRYNWPGNFRELESLVMRVAIDTIGPTDEITAEDIRRGLKLQRASHPEGLLEEQLGDGFELERVLNKVSYHYVTEAANRSGGNKSEMVRLLGFKSRTPLKTLLTNLKQAGYELDDA